MLLAFYVLFLLFFPQHIDTQKFNWNKKCCADLHWAGVLETLHSSTMSWDSCAIKWKFSRHAKKYFNLHETDVTSLTTVPSWNLDDHKAGAWFNVQKGILTHFDLLTKCGRKRIQFERWENWFIKFNFTRVNIFRRFWLWMLWAIIFGNEILQWKTNIHAWKYLKQYCSMRLIITNWSLLEIVSLFEALVVNSWHRVFFYKI